MVSKTELSRTQIRRTLEKCPGFDVDGKYHVYVLEFEDARNNGTVYYVGQSINPLLRIVSHAERYGDFKQEEDFPEMTELYLVNIVRVKSVMSKPRLHERQIFKETILDYQTTEVYGGR